MAISGGKILGGENLPNLRIGGHLGPDQYREEIWRSKINLSFVTQANEDDIAHKAWRPQLAEIPAGPAHTRA